MPTKGYLEVCCKWKMVGDEEIVEPARIVAGSTILRAIMREVTGVESTLVLLDLMESVRIILCAGFG